MSAGRRVCAGWRVAARLLGAAALMAVLVVQAGAPAGAAKLPAGAGDDHTVLILSTSVVGGAGSPEAVQAASLGFTIELADATQWAAKSAADFGTYRALVLGDHACGGLSYIQAAIDNRTTWSPEVDGNIMLIGGDPGFHAPSLVAAATEIRQSIGFAADIVGKTGLYAAFGCAYAGAPESGTAVAFLDQFGAFSVRGNSMDDVHKVASHPALAGLDDATLSNWHQSTHAGFTTFPAGWVPVAIMRNLAGNGNLTFTDGSNGVPYMLGRGDTLVPGGGPSITSISPASGPTTGGVGVTITGSGFTGATGATIGGADCTSFVVVNDTTITCTPAAHVAGAVDVVVGTATLTGGYTYVKVTPTITWATPASFRCGNALSATQLNASCGVAGSFVYTPASGTVLTAGTQTLSTTFTPTDTGTYNTATATVSMTVLPFVGPSGGGPASGTVSGLTLTYNGMTYPINATTTRVNFPDCSSYVVGMVDGRLNGPMQVVSGCTPSCGATSVPTLGDWGRMLLAFGLMLVSVWALRRARRSAAA